MELKKIEELIEKAGLLRTKIMSFLGELEGNELHSLESMTLSAANCITDSIGHLAHLKGKKEQEIALAKTQEETTNS